MTVETRVSSAVGERLHITVIVLEAPPWWNPRKCPHIPYISTNYNHKPTFCCRHCESMFVEFFSGGLRNTFLFLQEWRFGRSRPSKAIDFGTNRKRVCDFLLVRHSNLGLILHRFGDIARYCAPGPTPISPYFSGCSRCTRSLFSTIPIISAHLYRWPSQPEVTSSQHIL